MNVDKLQEIKRKLEKIQKEQMYGKGYRYDKEKRADEMALNLYLDGNVDWLIEEIDRLRTIEQAYSALRSAL